MNPQPPQRSDLVGKTVEVRVFASDVRHHDLHGQRGVVRQAWMDAQEPTALVWFEGQRQEIELPVRNVVETHDESDEAADARLQWAMRRTRRLLVDEDNPFRRPGDIPLP